MSLTSGNKKMKLEYFSNSRIDLQTEVNRHPKLCAQIRCLGADADWADKLAEIAAYVNVIMDGMYSPIDLDLVWYPDLTKRLENMRRRIMI